MLSGPVVFVGDAVLVRAAVLALPFAAFLLLLAFFSSVAHDRLGLHSFWCIQGYPPRGVTPLNLLRFNHFQKSMAVKYCIDWGYG